MIRSSDQGVGRVQGTRRRIGLASAVGCGIDAKRQLDAAQGFVDAGLDRLALMNSGLDARGPFRA
jgi:hypothetical protein